MHIRKVGRLFLYFIGIICLFWGTGAIYYCEIPFLPLRIILAVAFFIVGIYGIFIKKTHQKKAIIIGWLAFLAIFYVHWLMIKPSHDRNWRFDMKEMPIAIIDNDNITIKNYRNFNYNAPEELISSYEERTVQLSNLVSVDFYISYWELDSVAHTFLSFNFDNGEPVCISIEAKCEEGESFNPIPSLFKEYELIYIVGSERDIVKLRTNHRNENVYRYPLSLSPESSRALFMVYLERINELAETPEFYHLLSSNCTINISKYVNRIGYVGRRFDWRIIINGYSDRYLYNQEYVDTSIPFKELRESGHITPWARTIEEGVNFSEHIRNIGNID